MLVESGDMPELPEVETVVRQLRERLSGQTFADFVSHWPRNVPAGAAQVRAALQGRVAADVWRRGKFIVVTLARGSGRAAAADGYLLIHLRMSGRCEWAAADGPPPAHLRAEWRFASGDRLCFCDARKFGRITWTRDLSAVTHALGVEPLDPEFTPRLLHDLLKRRARRLKPLLLDQGVIAGIGNIYADEALHRAGLHPLLRSDQVDAPAARRLHGAIRAVLREGIRRNGATIDWVYPSGTMQDYLRVYGRTGEPCRACGAPIAALRVGQRGTHICLVCQPVPRSRPPATGRGAKARARAAERRARARAAG